LQNQGTNFSQPLQLDVGQKQTSPVKFQPVSFSKLRKNLHGKIY
jgi:hypothetical protein